MGVISMLQNIKIPIIVLNLKAYPHVLNADDALKYAKIAEEVAEESGVSIVIAPPQYHLSYVAKKVKIPVIAQHAEPIEAGAATGFVPLEAVKGAGAVGTLINHSEHRLKLADINFLVQKAKALDLISIVCTDVYETSLAAATLGPNFIAIE
ncbi:MAG TPA: triose-phosphate isomerase, partial [Euryarchaeota archaeon]|nr:triose-phosphate isomerase [Euryarchaeota archaeon]